MGLRKLDAFGASAARIKPEILREKIGREKVNDIQSKCDACFNGDCSGILDNGKGGREQVNEEKCRKTYSALGLRPSVMARPGSGGGSGGVFMLSSSSSLSFICLIFIILIFR